MFLEREVQDWEEGNVSGEQCGEAAEGRGHRGEQRGTGGVQLKGATWMGGATIYERIVSRGVAGTNLPCGKLHICVNEYKFVALGIQRRTEISGEPVGRASLG